MQRCWYVLERGSELVFHQDVARWRVTAVAKADYVGEGAAGLDDGLRNAIDGLAGCEICISRIGQARTKTDGIYDCADVFGVTVNGVGRIRVRRQRHRHSALRRDVVRVDYCEHANASALCQRWRGSLVESDRRIAVA